MLKSVAANFELRCQKAFHLSANLWLAGHGLTLAMKMFSVYYPNHQFHPWAFGSQRCEDFFTKLRCFCRGKPNLTLLDMIDLSSRVQKLEELKSRGVNPDIQPPNWPQDIDVELKEGMMMAEREVLKTLQLMGMLPALVKGNILKEDGDDIICLNTPGLGTFAVWESPDENEVIASDELLDLESEVLLTAIEEHCTSSSNALIDLAAATCLHQSEQVESEEEDEDSPTHCALYKENKCKYNNSTFKPPKKTLWVGCNYPCCNAWYHEQCLSLQFAGDKEREDYTLICPKHKDIKEHFRNKVTALSTDTNSLSDENISLQPMPKQLR